jgi:hypothetical protein
VEVDSGGKRLGHIRHTSVGLREVEVDSRVR